MKSIGLKEKTKAEEDVAPLKEFQMLFHFVLIPIFFPSPPEICLNQGKKCIGPQHSHWLSCFDKKKNASIRAEECALSLCSLPQSCLLTRVG